MDNYNNSTHRRLKQIQGHFMSQESQKLFPPNQQLNKQYNATYTTNLHSNTKSTYNLNAMFQQLLLPSKIGVVAIPPLTAFYILKLIKERIKSITTNKDIDVIFQEISGNNNLDNIVKLASKIIGLLGVVEISKRMQSFLGVKLTFSRSYQVLLTVSSILDSILSLAKIRYQKWGVVFCIVSFLYSLIYMRMLYFTLVHNKKLERILSTSKSLKFQGSKINIPALGTWATVVSLTLWVWLKEAKRLAQSTGGILSMTAFVISAIAGIRVGLRAATTSFPGLTPFEGSSAVLIAIILGALPLIPYWSISEWARTLLSGYLSIVVSMIINSSFAWKRPHPML
ncbi:transmembrane protein [Tieghemostelium lacteum]|uniref:Transmembrane protein n=1 Tax=Tieghemostelium lacteum TaxID=361077 RepID=A0A151Z8H4_TIELA|nr:transmembrane protein [Tieghemostelium lacteum]|eukprot:KYQ90228.1 transmembrane protein [Tieghemostelium lacteum]